MIGNVLTAITEQIAGNYLIVPDKCVMQIIEPGQAVRRKEARMSGGPGRRNARRVPPRPLYRFEWVETVPR